MVSPHNPTKPTSPFSAACTHIKNHHRASEEGKRKVIRAKKQFLAWWKANRVGEPVTRCSIDDACEFRNWLVQTKSASILNDQLAILKAVWDVMLSRGKVTENPFHAKNCSRVKPATRRKVPPPALTVEMIFRVIDRTLAEQSLIGDRDALLIFLVFWLRTADFSTVCLMTRHSLRAAFLKHPYGMEKLWQLMRPRLQIYVSSWQYDQPLFPPVERDGRTVRKPHRPEDRLKPADKSRLYSAIKKRGAQAGLKFPLTPTRIRNAVINPPNSISG